MQLACQSLDYVAPPQRADAAAEGGKVSSDAPLPVNMRIIGRLGKTSQRSPASGPLSRHRFRRNIRKPGLMLETLAGWELDVDRGPNWLFVKIRGPEQHTSDAPPLADRLWVLLQDHLANRVVLELDEIGILSSHLLGQLSLLRQRICEAGGTMRLCGLSPHNHDVLHFCRLDEQFPHYENREEAVLGCLPRQPR